jgi:hypothetical protein
LRYVGFSDDVLLRLRFEEEIIRSLGRRSEGIHER